MEKITILGSANAVAKADQQNTHLLIETVTHKILVDCGNHSTAGLKQAGVTLNQVTDLVLTHFHADHVATLPLILMDMWLEKRTEPLTVYGLGVTLEKANRLLELFDWQKWKGMFPVVFRTVPDIGDLRVIDDGELTLAALPVLHLVPTLGLRFEFPNGKIVAYSCDTEPCETLLQLAMKADVLLQESAGTGKGHTSPAQAGEIARQCGVGELVLIHYEASYGKKQLLSEARSTFNGKVKLAKDGMTL